MGKQLEIFLFGDSISDSVLALTIWKVKVLDVLNLGDEIATGLGVKVEKERKILFSMPLP